MGTGDGHGMGARDGHRGWAQVTGNPTVATTGATCPEGGALGHDCQRGGQGKGRGLVRKYKGREIHERLRK